jgi:hypothetical protein
MPHHRSGQSEESHWPLESPSGCCSALVVFNIRQASSTMSAITLIASNHSMHGPKDVSVRRLVFVDRLHRPVANVLPFMQFSQFLAQRGKSRSDDRGDFINGDLIVVLRSVARGTRGILAGSFFHSSGKEEQSAALLRPASQTISPDATSRRPHQPSARSSPPIECSRQSDCRCLGSPAAFRTDRPLFH